MRSYTIQTENWDETLIGCFYQLFLFMETEMNLFLFNLNIWREFKWKVIMRFFPNTRNSDTCRRNCNHTHALNWRYSGRKCSKQVLKKILQDLKVMVLGLMPKSIDRKVKKNIVYKYCSQQQLNASH